MTPDSKSGYSQVLKTTFSEFSEDKAMKSAAAVAFYAMLSLAPILILLIAIAGRIWGQEAAANQLAGKMQEVIGPQAASAIEMVIANAEQPGKGWAMIIGVVTLVFGATAVFVQLQDAMDVIWNVEPQPQSSIWGYASKRLLSLLMILCLGLLILATLVLGAVLTTINSYFQGVLPGQTWLWQGLHIVIDLALLTLAFAMMFKFVPDVRIHWHDVWVGAGVTAILFTLGRFLLSYYFGYSSMGSSYGAAGSLVALLVWIYYSAIIVFLGAEFTQVYARHRGARIVPDKHAVWLEGHPA